MFEYTTGDILNSNTEGIVNTVNCEGFMGKGIAYQFKLRFPHNNKEYVKVCRNNEFKIGSILVVKEANKCIFNFPTKDKWRRKSEYEYIEKGLERLAIQIINYNISSIAIPPLGCGNGGLQWSRVKELIEKNLNSISKDIKIVIYEPSKYYKAKVTEPPQINVSHLVLMLIKERLHKFKKLRLQKTCFFINLFLEDSYFKFEKHKFGPYCHAIDILSKTIKEFQSYYNLSTTSEAKDLAFKNLISNTTIEKLQKINSPIEKATKLVNKINSDKQLEVISTICYLVKENPDLSEIEIINEFVNWPKEDIQRFSISDIKKGIFYLLDNHIITKSLMGFDFNSNLEE